MDWNSDGHLDIIYSDTYQRTYLLLNDGTSKTNPTFTQQVFFEMEKRNHGMHAGGGDWNNDGVMDFLHMPFAGGAFKIFSGRQIGGGGIKFQEGGLKQCTVLKIGRDRESKARKCAWAWNYSGTAKQRGVIEYVGIAKNNQDIAFFELKDGNSRKVATLFTPEGKTPLLTAGDLNQDGRMDILFSCGLWNNERNKTKIYVMYGKVANIKGAGRKKEEPKAAKDASPGKPASPTTRASRAGRGTASTRERSARRYYELARSMRRARNFAGARRFYQKVVVEYGDTSWAPKARSALKKLP